MVVFLNSDATLYLSHIVPSHATEIQESGPLTANDSKQVLSLFSFLFSVLLLCLVFFSNQFSHVAWEPLIDTQAPEEVRFPMEIAISCFLTF